jgi:hypothetical protein
VRKLTPEGEYFKKAYIAVDGLWYLTVEKGMGLEKAVQADRDVWETMPKILARKTMELLHLSKGKLESLSASLGFRFDVEGYRLELNRINGAVLEIEFSDCPWRRAIMKSKNVAVLSKVGEEVCPVVYQAWAGEFLDCFELRMNPRICLGGEVCRIEISSRNGE